MPRLLVLGGTVLGLLAAPPAAAAKGCPAKDARAMLATAGAGINGRVLAIREDYLDVLAESSYAPDAVGFGEKVRIHGKGLPALPRGRIGVVLHRSAKGFTAERCDIIPATRMARAIRGRNPCPRPTVRDVDLRVTGRTARWTVRLGGDVDFLRVDSGQRVRRGATTPGVAQITETFTYAETGTYRASARVSGGWGPGCGSQPRRFASARRTIVIR